FLKLMDRFEPAYFIHGHNHRDYSSGYKREDRYGRTFVINAWESYELEVPEGQETLQKKNRKG
ncbi:MAG: metallophosphoesterase, partial [Lachnospiraceae bacterium]|nr:metallophosphoesterase [Lachnospiraceae bacterium]